LEIVFPYKIGLCLMVVFRFAILVKRKMELLFTEQILNLGKYKKEACMASRRMKDERF
jgi:hypothetical protein